MPRYVVARVLLGAFLVTGCPRKSSEKPTPSTECRKFGESCLLAPGKLGVCLERTPCPAGEHCFGCMSQH